MPLANKTHGVSGGWLASTVGPNVMRWILGVSFMRGIAALLFLAMGVAVLLGLNIGLR